MSNAVALGLRTRSETQKEPIAAIIGINMVDYALAWVCAMVAVRVFYVRIFRSFID